ncbi:MAG: glycosyltransferase [Betaproteobacteria bacterium]|nr:glycosyltransferase [Betaproteobacteria bacterium]
MQKRRILIVCDGLLKGGLARVVIDWIQGLTARGHLVGLALLGPHIDYPLPDGLWMRVHGQRAPSGGVARWRHRRALGAFMSEAVAAFEREHGAADLVIAAGESALRCAAHVSHPNLWMSSHSSQLQAPKGDGWIARLRFRIKVLRRGARLKPLLDGKKVHVVSEGLARELTATLGVRPARIEVIHNPFDVTALRARAALATPESTAQTREFIVGVGEFNPRKAFDRLITAFAHSRFGGDLVLIGQGPDQPALERQARDLGIASRVKFVPFHDNHYALVQRAKLLVMTSRSEGLGNVLIEALILGVPAVALDCPHGPRDILEPVCADALLAPEVLDQLPARIDRFVGTPYAIGETHLARFRAEHVMDRLLNLAGSPDQKL